MREGYLRGALSPHATQRQMDMLATYVAAGGSVPDAAELAGIPPSTLKRHLSDPRVRMWLTTEQLTYAGRGEGWLGCAEPRASVSNRWSTGDVAYCRNSNRDPARKIGSASAQIQPTS
jgi:hypothetical protein